MPKKGYITIAAKVDKETHDLLVEKAEDRGTSVNKLLGEIVRGYLSEGYVDKEGFSLDEHIESLNITKEAKEALKRQLAKSLKMVGRRKDYPTLEPPKKKVSVTQMTLEGMVVKTWESISEASEATGIAFKAISQCYRGIQKTAGGYIWTKA